MYLKSLVLIGSKNMYAIIPISSGIDIICLLSRLPYIVSNSCRSLAFIFFKAFAVHRLFTPVRISITLSFAPFIVPYFFFLLWQNPKHFMKGWKGTTKEFNISAKTDNGNAIPEKNAFILAGIECNHR